MSERSSLFIYIKQLKSNSLYTYKRTKVRLFFAFAHHHFPSKALMAQSISDLIFLHLNQLDNCFYMN